MYSIGKLRIQSEHVIYFCPGFVSTIALVLVLASQRPNRNDDDLLFACSFPGKTGVVVARGCGTAVSRPKVVG